MTKYAGGDAILVNEDKAVSIPVMVNDTNGSDTATTDDGFKYIVAGTWLGADADVTLANEPVVMYPTSDPKKVQGILLHDTNITSGNKITALVIAGYISRKLIDTNVKNKYYTDEQIHNLKSSMPTLTILDK